MSDAYAAGRRLIAVFALGLLLTFLLLRWEASLGLQSGLLVILTLALALAVSWVLVAELELLKRVGF